jgi:hypothetical protein
MQYGVVVYRTESGIQVISESGPDGISKLNNWTPVVSRW